MQQTMTEWQWEKLAPRVGSYVPCQRSLHSAAVWGDSMFIFGGYDGQSRVNDFYEFHVPTLTWSMIPLHGIPPSPRDRHSAVTYDKSYYVFGGFDGSAKVNDFYQFNFETRQWYPVFAQNTDQEPTPRHSHCAVIYRNSMYIFGGYDGSYKNDFYEYNFLTQQWYALESAFAPRARYRATAVTVGNKLVLFGGHDGLRHLNDTCIFNFETKTWTHLQIDASPSPRDSHVAVVHADTMYIYGGSAGAPLGDYHMLNLESKTWTSIDQDHREQAVSAEPGFRFCHTAVVYKDAMYIFGGYDGSRRLNDMLIFRFGRTGYNAHPPPSTMVTDLGSYVGNSLLSDVTFVVEGIHIPAHKILCVRFPYFRNLLTGEMMESRASEIVIPDTSYAIFQLVLEYMYTDNVAITAENAMELFKAADMFSIDRLKYLCERFMLTAITIESVPYLLHSADIYQATYLRQKCINFILLHFDEVSRTPAFEEMGRMNIELVFEILKLR